MRSLEVHQWTPGENCDFCNSPIVYLIKRNEPLLFTKRFFRPQTPSDLFWVQWGAGLSVPPHVWMEDKAHHAARSCDFILKITKDCLSVVFLIILLSSTHLKTPLWKTNVSTMWGGGLMQAAGWGPLTWSETSWFHSPLMWILRWLSEGTQGQGLKCQHSLDFWMILYLVLEPKMLKVRIYTHWPWIGPTCPTVL